MLITNPEGETTILKTGKGANMNTLEAIAKRKSTRAYTSAQIPEGFNLLLGAVFGYAADVAPAKEHTIKVNRI